MNKRGAITLFIIIGIVFLILFSMAIYFQDYITTSKEVKKIQDVPNELKPIYNYVTSCMEQSAKEAVMWNAMQGGYANIITKEGEKRKSMEYTYATNEGNFPFHIPFYVDAGELLIPSRHEVESQLRDRMLPLAEDCLDFSKLNYEITLESSKPELNIEFYENIILAKLIYPMKVKVGETVKEWSLFQVEVNSNYPSLFQAAKEYSMAQPELGNYVCVTCMQGLADKYDMYIDNMEIEDLGEVWYEVEDDKVLSTELKANHTIRVLYQLTKEELSTGENISFMFVHFFDIKDEYREEGDTVKIKDIPDIEAEVGYEFNYLVDADGINLHYFDNSEIFTIDMDTGLIQFTPTLEDVGVHDIIIAVIDDQDATASESFLLSVKKPFNMPSIESIDYQDTVVGEQFTYQVIAIADYELGGLTYFDDTELFDIDKETGFIAFVPGVEDVGEQFVKIYAVDEQGITAAVEMVIIVTESVEFEE